MDPEKMLESGSDDSLPRTTPYTESDKESGELETGDKFRHNPLEELPALDRAQSRQSIAETLSLPHEILFVAVICMAQLMTQAGLGQCLAILHVIGDHFGATSPGELSWLIAGYSLTVGSFILISGRFGDVFGYKIMFLIGFGWFSLWSFVAGLSYYSNHVLFVFARVFQGIGPAIILPNGLAILGATYPPGRRKSLIFAFFGATAPGGSVIGAAFAGIFNLTWWPWTFFSFAIALAGLTILAYLVIPECQNRAPASKSIRKLFWDLDILGALTGVPALVLINFAWNQAPIVGWQTPYVYVSLISGAIFILGFLFVEFRVARTPLIPFGSLSPDVGFVLACVALGWSCFGIWVFYSWEFFSQLRGASPLLVTAWMSPVSVSGALAAVVTGIVLVKLGPPAVMVMALTFFTVGTILMMTAPVNQSYWAQSFVCMIIIPWGMDMSFPAATLILSNAVKREDQGIAASLVNTVVNYSISLGLGFAGSVEVHVNHGGHTPEDLLSGYRAAWYLGTGLSGLGLLVSLIFLIKGQRQSTTTTMKT